MLSMLVESDRQQPRSQSKNYRKADAEFGGVKFNILLQEAKLLVERSSSLRAWSCMIVSRGRPSGRVVRADAIETTFERCPGTRALVVAILRGLRGRVSGDFMGW